MDLELECQSRGFELARLWLIVRSFALRLELLTNCEVINPETKRWDKDVTKMTHMHRSTIFLRNKDIRPVDEAN